METYWSQEIVEKLNAYQHNSQFHPYTCGKNSEHILEATPNGWRCPQCDYTQQWYHLMTLDPSIN